MTRPATSAGERSVRQRARILRAAEQCFIEHGFHAANMSGIARRAGVSPGLIYRYFDSKNAIILAIIDRQLQDKRANIGTLTSGRDLAARIKELFYSWRCADPSVMSPALFLEISAQASRDPQVAEAVTTADRLSGADLHEWLLKMARQAGESPSEQDISARVLLLQSFVEGLAVRAVREPVFDENVLSAALEMVLPVVLPSPD